MTELEQLAAIHQSLELGVHVLHYLCGLVLAVVFTASWRV